MVVATLQTTLDGQARPAASTRPEAGEPGWGRRRGERVCDVAAGKRGRARRTPSPEAQTDGLGVVAAVDGAKLVRCARFLVSARSSAVHVRVNRPVVRGATMFSVRRAPAIFVAEKM
jgi:hypothetical protein